MFTELLEKVTVWLEIVPLALAAFVEKNHPRVKQNIAQALTQSPNRRTSFPVNTHYYSSCIVASVQ